MVGCYPEITEPSSGGEGDALFEGCLSCCLLLMADVWFLLFPDN